jgi:uncharacterized Zn finger protein
MADAQVTEVRCLIDGLRRDRRQHPYSGRREYSERARAVAAAIAEMMLGSGRGDEAVALCREAFERRAIHRDYLRLRQAAERAGQWPDLRDWALDFLRARARAEPYYLRELISVLVREDLLGEAWTTAVASPGQVPEAQWHDLIGLREKDRPADVIRPFQDLIELGLERTSDKYRYPKAIKAPGLLT